ncbi:MAG: hypothetical protein IJL17_03285 [Kiritimatiellae bacterium]|nr:hypothetical protein [Kiritimatiellia bacterium]
MNVDRQEVCIIKQTKRLAALFFMPNTASLSCDVMSILSLFAMKSNTILSRPARQLSLTTLLLALILVGVFSSSFALSPLNHSPKPSMSRSPSLKFAALSRKRPP